jgi:hypothetical protein
MRPPLAAALFLASAGLTLAAPPDVPAKLTVQPGQLVRVTVKGDAPLGTLKNFTDEEAFWGELVSPKGQRQFVFQAPADGRRSTYVVGWWTKGEADGVSTTITVEGGKADPWPGPSPEPKPGPQPDPSPKPAPVAGTLFVVVVEEAGDRGKNPDAARVLNDLAFWQGLKSRDVLYRFYDDDAADAARLGYLPHATKAGLPALLTLDRGGKVLDARKLPATTAAIDTLLKGYGR